MIRWRLVRSAEAGAPPPDGGWLSPGERRCAEGFGVEKRRRDWLLGRWTLKRMVARALEKEGEKPPLAAIEVIAEPSGAPYVRKLPEGDRLAFSASISHSNGVSFCALLLAEGQAIGADVELVEPRSSNFVGDFFSETEVASWEGRGQGAPRDLFATAVWSAKEAVLKALKLGLTVDTRRVDVELLDAPAEGPEAPPGEGWQRFRVRCAPEVPGGDDPIDGYWWLQEDLVLALAVRRAGARPSGPSRGAARNCGLRPRERER